MTKLTKVSELMSQAVKSLRSLLFGDSGVVSDQENSPLDTIRVQGRPLYQLADSPILNIPGVKTSLVAGTITGSLAIGDTVELFFTSEELASEFLEGFSPRPGQPMTAEAHPATQTGVVVRFR